MSVKVEKILDPVLLGEGPHWDHRQQCLYFVSIKEKALHKYVPATGKHTKTTLDSSAGFIIPVEGTIDQFIVGAERKFLVMRWDGAEGSKVEVIKELGETDPDVAHTNINDGKVDAKGRLFAGTLGHDEVAFQFLPNKGSLYRIDSSKGFKVEKLADGISISNGLAWDVENKAFYYIDSMEKNIRRYDYDLDTGEISNLTYIFNVEKNNIEGIPDGMTIDTDGNLWVAIFGGSVVLKIDPKSGELLQKIPIPASQVTSVTFGGPNLDILFVTTGNINLGEEQLPTAGATYMVTGLGVKGHPNNNFKL